MRFFTPKFLLGSEWQKLKGFFGHKWLPSSEWRVFLFTSVILRCGSGSSQELILAKHFCSERSLIYYYYCFKTKFIYCIKISFLIWMSLLFYYDFVSLFLFVCEAKRKREMKQREKEKPATKWIITSAWRLKIKWMLSAHADSTCGAFTRTADAKINEKTYINKLHAAPVRREPR